MILRCRSVRLRAAVAGGMRCDQAYQRSMSGSTCTSPLRYSNSSFMTFAPLGARGISNAKVGGAGRPLSLDRLQPLSIRAFQPIDFRLVQAGERDIRRRETAGLRGRRVLDEPAEHREP